MIKPPSLPIDHPMLTPVRLYGDLVRGQADSRALRRALDSGEMIKVRRGAYASGRDWAALDAGGRHAVRTRAVVQQAKTDVLPSHVGALALLGTPTWGFDLTDVHVTRPDGEAGRSGAGVRQHCGHLAADDVVSLHGLRITSPTRTALDVTMLGNTEAALCAVNDLLHRGLTTEALLKARYLRSEPGYPRGMVHWPNSLATEHVLRLADPRVESVAESRALHLIWNAGLPMPTPQVVVTDDRGFVIKRVDFAWPWLGVFLEVNSRVKLTQHLRPGETPVDAVMRERRLIEQVVLQTGWRAVQWDWADLERPTATGRKLERFLDVARGAA